MSKKNNNSNNDKSMFSDLKDQLSNKYSSKSSSTMQENNDCNGGFDNVEEVNVKRNCVECKADDIGWDKPKVWLRNFFYGIFMGISDGIPGYSGGTTLSIIGFYDSLVRNFKLIFKPDVKKYFWKYLLWFLPFAIGWCLIFLGFSKLISFSAENNHGIIFVFLFGFFALFSIPLFYFKNKDDLPNYKTIFSQVKKKQINSIIKLTLIILGFLVLISFALMARFIPTSEYQDNKNIIITGITFLGDKQIDTSNFDSSKVFLWIFGSFISGFCVLIPGVSGGLVLYMTNIYPEFTYALSNFWTNANLLPWIIVVIIGSICGIILSSIMIDWFLKKWKQYFMCFSLGLVIASFVSIFISLSSNDYMTLSNGVDAGISVLMIFIAFCINAGIFIYLNQTKKIDFPKLRFKNKSNIQKVN